MNHFTRRQFFYILSAGALTVVHNACSPGYLAYKEDLSSRSPLDAPPDQEDPTPTPGDFNGQSPIWDVIPTISFTQGVPTRISIAAYVTDPDKDILTITKNAIALPPGVTFDVTTKAFVYDGIGGVALTDGHILTATEG